MRKLGILAGGGVLPRRIAETRLAAGGEVFVVAFEGQTESVTVDGLPHAWFKLGATDAALRRLKAEGVGEVVMAGPMRRPALSDLALDLRSTLALAKAGAKVFGDDGLLSVVIAEIERDGFTVLGIDDLLGGYLVPNGRLGRIEPDEAATIDIRRGLDVLRILAPADIGQAVAIEGGLVLAVEAIEGTDAMIVRAGGLKRGSGPVLVKARKIGQERRADLPTIGAETVRRAAEAGFRGIAVEAGRTILVDRAEAVALADERGLFMVGVELPGEQA